MKKRLLIGLPIFLMLGFSAFAYFYDMECAVCDGYGEVTTTRTCNNCKGKGDVDCDYRFTITKNKGGLDKFFDDLWGISSEPEKIYYKCKGGRYWSSTSYASQIGDVCSNCNGDGKVECGACNGYGEISSSRSCYKCDRTGKYTLFESWFD